MKLWRPYWNQFESAMNHFLGLAKGPLPFGDLSNIHGWIKALNFVDLLTGDDAARLIVRHLVAGDAKEYHPIFGGDDHFHQMALRCACALDFCQGRVENRKKFDWTQPPEQIYEFLLTEFWLRTALHWSWITFPHPKKKVEQALAPYGAQIAPITPIQHAYDTRAFYCWPSAPSG